ncbi:MAG TPA: hypothetical protein VGL72_17485 [Bryobacteraceae bacterium]
MSDDQADSLAAARKDAVNADDPSPVSDCPDAAKTWVEIVLEDDSGNPVSDEEYLITAPDGSEHSGTLDENGLARVDGIDPGTAQVSFPMLEDDDWSEK